MKKCFLIYCDCSPCRCSGRTWRTECPLLDKLASLQSKVNELQKSVQEVSDSAAELSTKADQLDALYPDDPTVASAAATAGVQSDSQNSGEVAGPSASSDSQDSSSQEEGTLSPSSGSSTFTDNSDSSMDNLLNQVQSLLPSGNGTWSVYVCNLAKIPKVPSMTSRCRLPA